MTIEVSLSELVDNFGAIKELMSAKVSLKAAVQLSRLGKLITAEISTYEEQKMKLAAELGTLNADKTKYIFTDENTKLFNEQNQAALSLPVIFDMDPVKLDDFGPGAVLSAQCLLACEKFIV